MIAMVGMKEVTFLGNKCRKSFENPRTLIRTFGRN